MGKAQKKNISQSSTLGRCPKAARDVHPAQGWFVCAGTTRAALLPASPLCRSTRADRSPWSAQLR